MNIKSIIYAGLIGLASALPLYSQGTEQNSIREKNKPSLESIVDVKPVLNVEGAKSTLVHIKQRHHVEGDFLIIPIAKAKALENKELYDSLKSSASQEDFSVVGPILDKVISRYNDMVKDKIKGLELTNKNQRQIYDICNKLLDNKIVNGIYDEGVFDERGDLPNPLPVNSYMAEGALQEFKDDCMAALSISEKEYLEKYRFVSGAAKRIAYDRNKGVYICDAAYDELGIAKSEIPIIPPKELLDKRENILLKDLLPHAKNEKYIVLIFGADHDFKNNIEEWNSRNPEYKVNLVTYTPEGFK